MLRAMLRVKHFLSSLGVALLFTASAAFGFIPHDTLFRSQVPGIATRLKNDGLPLENRVGGLAPFSAVRVALFVADPLEPQWKIRLVVVPFASDVAFNLYVYGSDNPLAFLDPLGLCAESFGSRVWNALDNFSWQMEYSQMQNRAAEASYVASYSQYVQQHPTAHAVAQTVNAAVGIASLVIPAGRTFGIALERGGVALQANTAEALALREQVAAGQQVYKAGNFPRSAAAESQFFSTQNPLTPGYANRVGAANLGAGTPDFIMGGRVQPGGPFITRAAPAVGQNLGGALEVVTPPGGVQFDFFYMP